MIQAYCEDQAAIHLMTVVVSMLQCCLQFCHCSSINKQVLPGEKSKIIRGFPLLSLHSIVVVFRTGFPGGFSHCRVEIRAQCRMADEYLMALNGAFAFMAQLHCSLHLHSAPLQWSRVAGIHFGKLPWWIWLPDLLHTTAAEISSYWLVC